jgi:hypothetical protein
MPETRLLPKPDTTLPDLPEHPGGTTKPYTSGLSYECVDVDAVRIDWSESAGEDCEGWQSFEAFAGESGFVRVLGCGDSSSDQDIDDDELSEQFGDCFPDVDPDSVVATDEDGIETTALEAWRAEVDDDSEEMPEGPMMNSYWPLGQRVDPQEAARDIRNLPLCVVEFGEAMQDRGAPGYALALTGGGTDLSWEIAEAYIRLGYLPPVALGLPAMSGRADRSEYGNMERDRRIIRACRASVEGILARMARKAERLADLESTC